MKSLLGIRFVSPVFPTFSGLGKVGVQGLKGFGNHGAVSLPVVVE